MQQFSIYSATSPFGRICRDKENLCNSPFISNWMICKIIRHRFVCLYSPKQTADQMEQTQKSCPLVFLTQAKKNNQKRFLPLCISTCERLTHSCNLIISLGTRRRYKCINGCLCRSRSCYSNILHGWPTRSTATNPFTTENRTMWGQPGYAGKLVSWDCRVSRSLPTRTTCIFRNHKTIKVRSFGCLINDHWRVTRVSVWNWFHFIFTF